METAIKGLGFICPYMALIYLGNLSLSTLTFKGFPDSSSSAFTSEDWLRFDGNASGQRSLADLTYSSQGSSRYIKFVHIQKYIYMSI